VFKLGILEYLKNDIVLGVLRSQVRVRVKVRVKPTAIRA